MVAAEKYALNHECVSNNEVLRIKLSSYISFRYTREMRQRERERQGDNLAHGDTKSRVTAWKLSYVATTCTSTGIFGLSALVSDLLFVSMWGTCTFCMLFRSEFFLDARWWATYRESSALP